MNLRKTFNGVKTSRVVRNAAFLKRCNALPLPLTAATLLLFSVILSSGSIAYMSQQIKTLLHGGGGITAIRTQMLVITFAMLALGSGFRVYLSSVIGQHVGSAIKQHVFSNVIQQPVAYFENKQNGDLVSLITGDAAIVENAFRSSFTPFIRNSLIVIFAVIMIVKTDLGVALSLIACAPIVCIASLILSRKHSTMSDSVAASKGQLAAVISEKISAVSTIKTLSQELREVSLINSIIDLTQNNVLELAKQRSIALVCFIALGGLLFILLFGGISNRIGLILPAKRLESLLFYIFLAAGAGSSLGALWNGMVDSVSALDRIRIYCPEAHGIVTDQYERINLDLLPFENLTFNNVSYSYSGYRNIMALQEISFTIKSGERVAIVGHSGSGKSTIIRLILALDYPQSGHIYLNGTNTAAIDVNSIREKFSVVPQDPHIFSMSLIDNIRYGRPNASDAEVWRAIEIASLVEFVKGLPEGLQTHVGERGSLLSGGERQRVAIARAILRRAPVIIFDEGTSALDPATERAIEAAMRSMNDKQAFLLITHKPGLIQGIDRLILMQQGHIEANGDPLQIAIECEAYRDMFG